ncbi:hypothetical protein ACLB1R_06790 [Escherichia coli]
MAVTACLFGHFATILQRLNQVEQSNRQRAALAQTRAVMFTGQYRAEQSGHSDGASAIRRMTLKR